MDEEILENFGQKLFQDSAGNKCHRLSIGMRICILISMCLPYFGLEAQPFVKINSGTKADIRDLISTTSGEPFFLTEKIYAFNGFSWKKQPFSIERIDAFFPVSQSDVWFSQTLETYISQLYHAHDGIIENVKTPFANYITAISFQKNGLGFFAGRSEVAIFSKNTFKLLQPVPTQSSVTSIYGLNETNFWVQTFHGELFQYNNHQYRQWFKGETVSGISFLNPETAYALVGNRIVEITKNTVSTLVTDKRLIEAAAICCISPDSIIVAGRNGLLFNCNRGVLEEQFSGCLDDLNLITTGTGGDVWIAGKNGRLLYSGKSSLAQFDDNDQGFSFQPLFTQGISANNEYGVAMEDVSGDGKLDIYAISISGQNKLLINRLKRADKVEENLDFTDEAFIRNASGLKPIDAGNTTLGLKLGVALADIDNDGDQDLYICYLNGPNQLLLNNGKGVFRFVGYQGHRACEDMHRSNTAAFADVDIDGDLDLFVANEEGSNRLFVNDGTGHFDDVTATSGLQTENGGMCASFGDVNNDGLPDLAVTFWYPSDRIYLNESANGKIYFRDVTNITDLSKAPPSKSNGVVFADVNNDGFSDLYIARRNAENSLYINNGLCRYIDRTADYFPKNVFLSNGAVFADFDLDGFKDLYLSNVGDNVFFKNLEGKSFADRTADFGVEMSGYCTGSAVGDIDNDNDIDLYVGNFIKGNSKLFLNISNEKHSVKLLLEGTHSNRDAIGTKVWLFEKTNKQAPKKLAGYWEVTCGSGYGSVSAKEVIMAVQPNHEYFARVKFPSSKDTLIISGFREGEIWSISEEKGLSRVFTLIGKSATRLFRDRENQTEIIKYILFLTLLSIYLFRQKRKGHEAIYKYHWIAILIVSLTFVVLNQWLIFSRSLINYFVAPMVALVLITLSHFLVGNVLLKRIARRERLELREKLARDLHDDLASTLGSIAIYSDTLRTIHDPAKIDFKRLTIKIAELTQSSLQSITDIIWMTSPRNDSLQSLINKIANYMIDILTDNNIMFSNRIDLPTDSVLLPEKIRNDAFLILKEAFNNILRHSNAQNVSFSAMVKNGICEISLIDDGIGIATKPAKIPIGHGNGLINMRKRAAESGIDLQFGPGLTCGTQMVLRFEI